MVDGPNWNKSRAKQHPFQRGRGQRGQMPGGSTSERLNPGDEHGVSVGGGIPSGHTHLSPLRKFDLGQSLDSPPTTKLDAASKTTFHARIQSAASGGPVDGKATSQAESARGAIDHVKISGGMANLTSYLDHQLLGPSSKAIFPSWTLRVRVPPPPPLKSIAWVKSETFYPSGPLARFKRVTSSMN